MIAAAFYSIAALAANPSALLSIVTDRNSSSANVSAMLMGDAVFSYSNYSDADLSPEANSTFKWFRRTLYQPQNRSLVGYWKLDGNANDSSIYLNHGTMINGAQDNRSQNCRIDSCLYFDGVNDYVNASEPASLNITDSITVEAWVMPRSNTNFLWVVGRGSANNGDTQTSFNLGISNGGNTATFCLNATATAGCLNSLVSFSANQWYHWAATYDGSTVRLYQNGVEVANEARPGRLAIPGTPGYRVITIGNDANTASSAENFNGNIDEVAIYNYAKSAAEIYADYVNSTYSALIYRGAVAYWHLDENGGTNGYADSSGNGNAGSYNGNPVNVSGLINGAVDFDGTGDYATVNDGSSLRLTEGLTIALWFKADAFTSWDALIGKFHSSEAEPFSSYALKLTNDPNKVRFGLNISGSESNLDTVSAFSVNNWYHIAATYDKNQMRIYVNGRLDNNKSQTGSIGTNAQPVTIGRSPYNAAYDFNGVIDEVAIYNRSLSTFEVTQLYLRTWYDVSPQLFLLQPFKDNYTWLNTTDQESPTSVNLNTNMPNVTGPVPGTFALNLTSNGYINYSAEGNFNEREGTIEFWTEPEWNGNDGLAHTFFGAEVTNNNALIYKSSDESDLEFYTTDEGIPVSYSVAEWLAGEWHHVAVTWNNYTSNMTLHIDGVQVNNSGKAFKFNAPGAFRLGSEAPSPQNFCNCTLSEFRVSRKALTAQEINLSYSRARPLLQNEYLLNGSNYVKGGSFKMEYIPRDNTSSVGAGVNSSFITLHNTPPPSPVFVFPKINGSNQNALSVNFTSAADVDGDAIVYYLYDNRTGGFNQSGSGNMTLPAGTAGVFTFNLSAFDGTDWSGNVTIYNVTIDAVAPVLSVVPYSLANDSFINATYALVNVSATEATDHSAFVDFNNSLVGYWRFEDDGDTNASDFTRYSNNGTLYGFGCAVADCNLTGGAAGVASGFVSNGKRGRALSFDGVDDFVNVTNSTNLSSSTALTIAVWAKPNILNNWRDLVGKGTTDLNKEYGIALGATDVWFSVGDNNGPYIQRPATLVKDKWHFIVATHSRSGGTSTLKLYVDGVDLGGTTSGDTRAPNNLNGLPLTIGYGAGINAPGYFNGSIDEVMIWNRVLNATEINASFNAGIYRLERNFTGLSDGNYTWSASAVDSAGNLVSTGLVNFSVDTKAPSIQFVASTPANGTFINRKDFFVNASHDDAGSDHNDYSAFVDFNNSLVGYWRFEDDGDTNATDFTSYGNNATLLGFGCAELNCNLTGAPGNVGSGWASAGKRGRSLMFDGIDDRVVISTASQPHFNFSGRNFSFAAWFKMPANANTNDTELPIVSNRDANNVPYQGYEMFIEPSSSSSANKLSCTVKAPHEEPSSQATVTSSAAYNDGKWHLAVCVQQPNISLELFVDGVSVGSDTSDVPSDVSNDDSIIIGTQATQGGWNFNGSIDEVMILGRVLGSQEIKALYSAGVNRLSRNFTHLPNGNYSYRAFVVDAAGTINGSENRTFAVDTASPSIAFGAATEPMNINLSRRWLFVNVTVSEAYIKNVSIELWNSTHMVNRTNFTNSQGVVQGSNVTFQVNFTAFAPFDAGSAGNVSDGIYRFNATVFDSSENSVSTAWRTAYVDATPPVIDYGLNSDGNGSFVARSWILMNFSYTEPYNSTFLIRNGSTNWTNVNASSAGSGTGYFFYKFENLDEGNYSFFGQLNDSASNVVQTVNRTVVVDLTPPSINAVRLFSNATGSFWVGSNSSSEATVYFNSIADGGSEIGGGGQQVTVEVAYGDLYRNSVNGNASFGSTPSNDSKTHPQRINYVISTGSGNASVLVSANDTANNTDTAVITFILDINDTTTSDNSSSDERFWYDNANVTINLSAYDAHSGVNRTYYCVYDVGGFPCVPASGQFTFANVNTGHVIQLNCSSLGGCQQAVRYYSMDNVSNNESGGANGGAIRESRRVQIFTGNVNLTDTAANRSVFLGNAIVRGSNVTNSTIDSCIVSNSWIVRSTVIRNASLPTNCTVSSSTVFDTNITSSTIMSSYIDPSFIYDSYVTNSNLTNATVYYSRIENSTTCAPNFNIFSAVVRNNTLVSGTISFNGTDYFAPFSLQAICANSASSPIGTLSLNQTAFRDSSSILFTYSATQVGRSVSIPSVELSRFDNTSTSAIYFGDGGTYPDDISDDAIYRANYTIGGVNNVSDGSYRIFANVSDNLGNDWRVPVNITLDNAAPNASVQIFGTGIEGFANASAEYTASRVVALITSFNDTVGIDKCRYANENQAYGPWESCMVSRAWLLSEGGGNKTVIMDVRDSAGNVNTVNDSIFFNATGAGLDATPPLTPSVVDDGTYMNTDVALHAAWNSTDHESELLHVPLEYEYRIRYNGTSDASIAGFINESFTYASTAREITVHGMNLSDGNNYTFEVRAVNTAGMRSSIGSSDGIIVDVSAPSLPGINSTHLEGNWSQSSELRFNWTATDSISNISAYSYVLDTNSSTVPDSIPESESEHVVLATPFSDGQSSVLKYNSSGNASTVYVEVRQNLSVGDVLRVTIQLAESHFETPDRMGARVYATGMVPTGFNMTANNISEVADFERNVEYVSGLKDAASYSADVQVNTAVAGSRFFVAIAGSTADNDNNYNLLIAASNASYDSSRQSYYCTQNVSCLNTTNNTGYAVTVAQRDLRADSIWDRAYANIGDGTFYFHVRAQDKAGNFGPVKHYQALVDRSAPSIPQMILPLQRTSNISQLTFNWTDSTDPESGVGNYSLAVDNDSSFSSPEFYGWLGNITNYTVTGLTADMSYYGRVHSRNGAGVNSSWSDSISLAIDTTPPVITLSKPRGTVVTNGITVVLRTNEKAVCSAAEGTGSYVNLAFTNSTLHETRLALSSGDGDKTFNVKCADAVNRETTQSWTITVDSTATVSSVTLQSPSVFTEELVDTNVTVMTSSGTGLGEISRGAFSLKIGGNALPFSLFDAGGGNYTLSFRAPSTNGSYAYDVTVSGVAAPQSTLKVSNLLLVVQYVDAGISANKATKMVYTVAGNFSIGMASDSRSVTTTSAAGGINLSANARDGEVFVFVTRSSGNVERASDLLNERKFLDAVSPSFGYQIDQQTFLVFTNLEYGDIALSGNKTLKAGKYNLVVENKGFDTALNKTKLEVRVT